MNSIRLIVTLIFACCITHALAFHLPPQTTKSYECKDCPQLSHEILQEQWDLSSDFLQKDRLSNRQKSYAYKKRVTARQLDAGITVSTTAPGAIVRITPLQEKAIPLLHISRLNKPRLTLKEASFLYNEGSSLDSSIGVTTHQTIFQMNPKLGSGDFIISSKDYTAKIKSLSTDSPDSYMIHVYDKFSPVFLQIETDSIHYQYGDKVTATISMSEGSFEVGDISAHLINSKEEKIPLELIKVNAHTFKASKNLDSDLNDHGVNWHVEADIVTGLIKRSGHCAFSYSIPSASVVQIRQISSKPLTFIASIEVATASRYALQSVLFHKNDQGKSIPLKTSQKAEWLEPGMRQIEFTFNNTEQFKEETLYLGYLRLIDYGQLKAVYQFDEPISLNHLMAP